MNYIYMQGLTITVWKIIFLRNCVRVNSMCGKLVGIFKHIGLTTWTHASVCMGWHDILIQKIKKWSKNMKTLLDLMSCHQDDVVKKLACLTKVWTHTPHKSEQLARRLMVLRGNNACLMTNGRYLPLTAFKFFSYV